MQTSLSSYEMGDREQGASDAFHLMGDLGAMENLVPVTARAATQLKPSHHGYLPLHRFMQVMIKYNLCRVL